MGTDSHISWAHAAARRASLGKSHCQDSVNCRLVGSTFLAALSDGAGSAKFGALGSGLACVAAVDRMAKLVVEWGCPGLVPDHALGAIVPEVRHWLRVQAAEIKTEVDDLSCTLICVMADGSSMAQVQVGDGACVVQQRNNLQLVRWPDQGEFANSTYFVTSPDAENHVHIDRLSGPINHIAVFSDGLQYLVLDNKSKLPHLPFFVRLFGVLPSEIGESSEVAAWLDQMLDSQSVQSRTDDDTSIVVARRIG